MRSRLRRTLGGAHLPARALKSTFLLAAFLAAFAFIATLRRNPDLSHVNVAFLSGSKEGNYHAVVAAAAKQAAHSGGRIVNVASAAGKEGVPGIAAYAASKHGVVGFTKSLARELADSGVLVNCVAPVMTETDLLKQMTPEHIAASKAKIPMGRFLTVEEIAAMVAWIAGPECSFTTGFTFDLSGGRANY